MLFNSEEIVDEDVIDEIIEEIYQENIEINTNGIVYLLKSKTYSNTYKVGITTNLQVRLNSLKKDNRYGIFSLEPIMILTTQDYEIIEKVLHKFFEDYRLCKKNDIGVDTELFMNIPTIEQEFELFAEFLSKNPRFKNVEFKKI